MNSTVAYPVFLFLESRICVVVGLGEVGCRKLAGLLAARTGCILALDLRAPGELSSRARELLAAGQVRFEQRSFAVSDAQKATLVFAATDHNAENLRIARLCRQHNAFCNCVTSPEAGDFIVPSVARSGSLCLALSTAGQTPALARIWREELSEWLAQHERLAWLLGRLRQPLLEVGLGHEQNAAIFRQLATSHLAEWLGRNDLKSCRDWLLNTLPGTLSPTIQQVLAEYEDAFC